MSRFDGSRSRCFYAVLSGRKVVCLARSKSFAEGFLRDFARTRSAKLIACYPLCYPEQAREVRHRKSAS